MLIMTQAGLAFKKGQHGEGQPAQQPALDPASIGADEDAKAGAVITTGGDKPCESVQEPANGWLRGNEKLHIAMARVLSVLPGVGAVRYSLHGWRGCKLLQLLPRLSGFFHQLG